METGTLDARHGAPCNIEPPKREWYAIQTLPRHEKSVTSRLEVAGIETVLPLCAQLRRWSDRRKTVHVPLFPCYLFVRTAYPHQERIRLLRTVGVVGFVGARREPLPIPESQIDSIRSLIRESAEFSPYPYLRIGQRVRVRSGALQGMEGLLVRIADDNSLVLSVDLIQKSVAVTIAGYAFEAL